MVKIIGRKEHADNLRRIAGPDMVKAVGAALYEGASDIAVEAQISLTTGAVSGKRHTPSAPGTPPNNDTGTLANNIEAAQTGPLSAEVSSNAPYAAIQEFGGTINHPGGTAYFMDGNGMAVFVPDESVLAIYLPRTKPHQITLPERPYMRPATEARRKDVIELVRQRVSAIVGGARLRVK